MNGTWAARGAGVVLLALAAATAAQANGADVPSPAAKLTPAGEGRRVFMKLNCYGCHGVRGAGGMGPSLRGRETDELVEKVTRGAEEGMPSFAHYVDQTDLANLKAYIRSLGTSQEPVFNDWWKKNPPH